MRDLLSSLRLATIRALESTAAFVAGPEAVAAHKAARAETFAAWSQLPHTTRDALALRAALGCLVMVARGKENHVGESDTELRDLGMEVPLRELAGRIEASRRVNPLRRQARAAIGVSESRADDARQGLANLQRSYALLIAAHGLTARALSLAMSGDALTVSAVHDAQAALAKQNPAMHLDIAAVVARMGAPPATTLLTEGDPLYVGAAGCERCGNDTGSRHGTCYVAPDEDEPAVGDEPTLVSQ